MVAKSTLDPVQGESEIEAPVVAKAIEKAAYIADMAGQMAAIAAGLNEAQLAAALELAQGLAREAVAKIAQRQA